MPQEWEDDGFDGKKQKPPTLRPPLYNVEDYSAALKQMFSSSHQHPSSRASPAHPGSLLIEHSTNGASTTNGKQNQPEMGMKKFLNGSELLFKLEADLRNGYPSFLQEFVSGQYEGVGCLLEALKIIQATLEDVSGIREQRKLLMDEQKCLQCIKLALRNIETVSKLASYPGGLYPLAAAMISTVTATRIIALEVLSCICLEGGADGHYKVCEALSTLRLRVGEPLRCKLIVGAISSAPPGTFQAKGIKFLTSFIASAPDPKHKVHIQVELEEAGFNAGALRKAAELGGARESREVHVELDEWERVIIDVDTLTRQNSQLRNSVATLQQELATLKDKLKRMDTPPKTEDFSRKRTTRAKRADADAVITTPMDSEEEAEQIHQILEDLNNIVNSEKIRTGKKEQEIVPVHLIKSPPKKKVSSSTSAIVPRPWPGSSASDDDDSDILELERAAASGKPNVLKVVQQLENMEKSAPKHFRDKHQKLQNLPIAMSKSISPMNEPKDYSLPNFHKANPMSSKFANFKSSKLYSSSPDNSSGPDSRSSSKNNVSSGYAEVYEKSSGGSSKFNISSRFSPDIPTSSEKKRGGYGAKHNGAEGLRRSESFHASLASIELVAKDMSKNQGQPRSSKSSDKWKSMDSLEKGKDENFTLRWKYPNPHQKSQEKSTTPSPKSASKTAKLVAKKEKNPGVELCADYRQNRFTKHSKTNTPFLPPPHGGNTSSIISPLNIFSRYSKKSPEKEKAQNYGCKPDYNQNGKEKENVKMFSLPPILMSHALDNPARLHDLPSGLY